MRLPSTPENDAWVIEMMHKRLVHEVHTSERRSFRGCRRRWHWVFLDFYYPKMTAKPLEFGVAFHEGMEVLYDPSTWNWTKQSTTRMVLLNSAIEKFIATCRKQEGLYKELTTRMDLEPDQAEDYNERVALGKGMLEYYWKHVAPKYDDGFRPISVEQEFLVPIQDPDTQDYLLCKCARCLKTMQEYVDSWEAGHPEDWSAEQHEEYNILLRGLPVVLAGRIDLIAEDRNGDLWIVDWKTAARLARGDTSGQNRDEFLELDDQIGSYVMALRRKLRLNVRGFIYVELKKSIPGPPKRNATIRLGRAFSVSKSNPVDMNEFIETVAREDEQAYRDGLYDEFITWLREEGQNFHGRYQVHKDDLELEEIERNLFMEAADMTDPDLRIYPSAGRFGCGFCAFRQPCLEKNRQGDYTYLLDESGLFDKRDKHYWVKDSSTDSQGGE